jgi:hypothetical protein
VRVEARQSVSGGGPAIAGAHVIGTEGLEPLTAQRAAPHRCAERGIAPTRGCEISARPRSPERNRPSVYDAARPRVSAICVRKSRRVASWIAGSTTRSLSGSSAELLQPDEGVHQRNVLPLLLQAPRVDEFDHLLRFSGRQWSGIVGQAQVEVNAGLIDGQRPGPRIIGVSDGRAHMMVTAPPSRAPHEPVACRLLAVGARCRVRQRRRRGTSATVLDRRLLASPSPSARALSRWGQAGPHRVPGG